MSHQLTASVTITRARLRGSAQPSLAANNVLTMTQAYDRGTTDAEGNFVSAVSAFVDAVAATLSAPEAPALRGAIAVPPLSVSLTYAAGPQDPVTIQRDLVAKIRTTEQLAASGDHVLAPDGTVLPV